MTKIHITYAGCPPEFIKRLTLAANLLYSNGYTASIGVWEGGRGLKSNLYIASEDDGFAMKVAVLARQNEIPVLIARSASEHSLTRGGVSYNDSVHAIYKALAANLSKIDKQETDKNSKSVLVQLSESEDDLIEVKNANGESVILNFNSGFCRARSKFSLESVARSISQKSTWLHKLTSDNHKDFTGVQTTIENFIFNALIFRVDTSYDTNIAKKLKHWPDIHLNEYSLEITKIATLLTGRPTSIKELEKSYDNRLLTAFYWAIRIAKIAEYNHPKQPQQPLNHNCSANKVQTTISKLVQWLGRSN